ncbi:cyclic peptide export ABC transporter [Paenibacillus tengchongensis]|uniref:cyclic peptide export ABC transporter n=1 Tax=Paenibacillus tengchongensis TaxID=2608684 RepID=UPI00124CC6DE|nr:cyclic peptide export ABC transporter [Paenibacillus tengchongensis]
MRKAQGLFIAGMLIFTAIFWPIRVTASTVSSSVSLAEDEKTKIEEYIHKQMKEAEIPGLSVVVVKADKTIYEQGFGYADVEKKSPVTPKTLFEIGSNSKALTALGILKLQEEGVIRLEEPVSKYIPGLNMNYKGQSVSPTIQQFLDQTSGVPFKTIDSIPISNQDNALEETVERLNGVTLDSEPGSSFQYATINYDVLGLIIEKVTGKSYEDYMKENVIHPLGLKSTYLFRNEIITDEIAAGYKVNFSKAQKYDAPEYRGNKPAGYFIMNAEDMAQWMKIQIGTGESGSFDSAIIKKSHIADHVSKPLSDGSYYRNGWFIFEGDEGEISHGGNNPNYSSYILMKPSEQLGVAVLSNTNSAYTELIGRGIHAILSGDQPEKSINDLNTKADKASVVIIIIVSALIAAIVYLGIKALYEIGKKRRKLVSRNIKEVIGLIVSLIFMSGVSYCLQMVPVVLFQGVSWGFIDVWLPNSLTVTYHLIFASLWLTYAYLILVYLFKKENNKNIVLLGILSFISGIGNSIIILSINMAITSTGSKTVFIYFFVLGLSLYVGGQKIVRKKLIEMTNGVIYLKRIEIINKLLKTSYMDFENIENGKIQATLNNDTETVSRFVNIVITGITSTATLVCCFIYLGFINFYGLLLSTAIILIIAGIYFIAGIYANKIGEKSRDFQNTFFKFIDDLIGGFKELSLNEKRKKEFETDMSESCNEYRIMRGKSTMAFANMFVIGELLFTLAVGSVAFIFPFVFTEISASTLTTYIFVLLYMTGPVHGILDSIPNLIDVKISWKRINEFLKQLSSLNLITLPEQQLHSKHNIEVHLERLEYEYMAAEGSVFKVGPIDYRFKSGEINFITGGNGSGKSTLAKLITGLYTPTKGNVCIDGKEVEAGELRQFCSAIFSDFHLFEKLYGIDYKEQEGEISKYLKLLNMDSKVQVDNGRFSTIKLSTGQKKRLALLISYLEDKPIYLFDEWAADQDPEFRKFFYNILLPDLKSRGKCVIAITHDDYYFGLADQTLKLELGKCVS